MIPTGLHGTQREGSSPVKADRAAAFLLISAKMERGLLICCHFRSDLKIPPLRCVCGFMGDSRSIVTENIIVWVSFHLQQDLLFSCWPLVTYKALPCFEGY